MNQTRPKVMTHLTIPLILGTSCLESVQLAGIATGTDKGAFFALPNLSLSIERKDDGGVSVRSKRGSSDDCLELSREMSILG